MDKIIGRICIGIVVLLLLPIPLWIIGMLLDIGWMQYPFAVELMALWRMLGSK